MNNISSKPGQGAVTAVLIVIVLVIGIGATYLWQQQDINSLSAKVSQLETELAKKPTTEKVKTSYKSAKGVTINVFTPLSGASVESPMLVMGQVPGNWSFEASFPIVVKDSAGKVLVQKPVQVIGDWMTEELVPFAIELKFDAPATGTGTIEIQRDNPSGLAANEDKVVIPVKF